MSASLTDGEVLATWKAHLEKVAHIILKADTRLKEQDQIIAGLRSQIKALQGDATPEG